MSGKDLGNDFRNLLTQKEEESFQNEKLRLFKYVLSRLAILMPEILTVFHSPWKSEGHQ